MLPRQYQLNEIDKIDPDVARAGNMQSLRHLRIYQKVKSETNCKYDLLLKSLELQDIIQLWIEENKLKNPFFRLF